MRWKLTAFLTCSLILTPFTSAFAATEKVLYSFTGGDDGSQPFAGVVLDAAGNLYGTAQAGGAHGAGVVFELSPSQSGWTETVFSTHLREAPMAVCPSAVSYSTAQATSTARLPTEAIQTVTAARSSN